MNRLMPSTCCFAWVALGMCWSVSSAYSQTVQPDQAAPPANALIRYADARLRLAEVNLEEALEQNERVAGVVSDMEVEQLKANVELARRQLEITKRFNLGTTVPTQVTAAEAAAKIADLDLSTALKANEKLPGAITESRIKRLRIKAEMAKIRVELWKDPVYIPSLMEEMQWQIDRLTEQVIELGQRLDSVTPK